MWRPFERCPKKITTRLSPNLRRIIKGNVWMLDLPFDLFPPFSCRPFLFHPNYAPISTTDCCRLDSPDIYVYVYWPLNHPSIFITNLKICLGCGAFESFSILLFYPSPSNSCYSSNVAIFRHCWMWLGKNALRSWTLNKLSNVVHQLFILRTCNKTFF